MGISQTQQIVEDLKALIKKEARLKAGLPQPAVRNDIPAGRGVGFATTVSKAGGGSGGIASPLTEQAGKRTYYPDRYISSTDGIFSFAWAPTRRAEYKDANGAEVLVDYVDPDA